MIDSAARRSRELFETDYYCAESVLMAIAEAKGIHSDLIPRIATGFCSGIARTSGQCGAVSGAIMGLSLLTGRSAPQDSREENYAAVRKLMEQFERRFGSVNCGQLLGCDLDTPEGQATYQANNLREACSEYVEEATRMALTLLEE